VQGGGPQGVLAINSNPRDVIARHLEATRLLKPEDRLDLVVWPENAIDVDDFTTSRVREDIVNEARRLQAPFAVGVTEDAGENFTNAQIIVDIDGQETSRYDKVRRVPYGEYVPLRSLLSALGAPVDRIPRDAVAGESRAILELVPHRDDTQDTSELGVSNPPSVTLAVAISWEVFFSGRVNDGVAAGGEVVLNPTNGSSYTGEILQRQQVATSRLRALESGRFVVQAATTGYSVVVDSNGRVLQRIPIGSQAVIFHDVPLRSGRTVYSLVGDRSVTMLMFAIIVVGVWFARRTRRQATQ
jgi:apolipoprotein N-acyltransferase